GDDEEPGNADAGDEEADELQQVLRAGNDEAARLSRNLGRARGRRGGAQLVGDRDARADGEQEHAEPDDDLRRQGRARRSAGGVDRHGLPLLNRAALRVQLLPTATLCGFRISLRFVASNSALFDDGAPDRLMPVRRTVTRYV